MNAPSSLASRLPAPDRLALFLDVDGTLIGPTPEARAAGIPSERIALLERLVHGLDGAIAGLTGRSLGSFDKIVAPLKLAAGGMQGCERRYPDGRLDTPSQTEEERVAIQRVADAIADAYPHLEIDWKPNGLALVFNRVTADLEPATALAARAAGGVLKLIRGHVAVDIVPKSASKGAGLAAFMATPPFSGRIPIHFGDDLPDEPAFEAALALGGYGVAVGDHPFENVTETLADCEDTWATLSFYARKWNI